MVIFVLEPDPVLLSQYAASLSERPGRTVITFRTADLASKALEKVIPDIVLLELAMPGHNGLEFLYDLRSYSDTNNTNVVVNSFVQESNIPWGFVNRGDFGIVDYLYKPFTTLDDVDKAINAIT